MKKKIIKQSEQECQPASLEEKFWDVVDGILEGERVGYDRCLGLLPIHRACIDLKGAVEYLDGDFKEKAREALRAIEAIRDSIRIEVNRPKTRFTSSPSMRTALMAMIRENAQTPAP